MSARRSKVYGVCLFVCQEGTCVQWNWRRKLPPRPVSLEALKVQTPHLAQQIIRREHLQRQSCKQSTVGRVREICVQFHLCFSFVYRYDAPLEWLGRFLRSIRQTTRHANLKFLSGVRSYQLIRGSNPQNPVSPLNVDFPAKSITSSNFWTVTARQKTSMDNLYKIEVEESNGDVISGLAWTPGTRLQAAAINKALMENCW